ncbi:MAG: RibD family protein, partial [bacterium]
LKGTAYTIGTDVDHYLLRQLRVYADAVLCGAGTLRNDDVIIVTHPHLQERRAKAGKSPHPLAVVAAATAEFSDEVMTTKKFFKRKDLDRLIVTTPRAQAQAIERIRAAGVAVEVLDANPQGEVDLPRLMRWLRSRGVENLLCEGGPTLNVSLARAGALDHLFVTTALRLGGEADEPRIFSEPVTDRALTLVSEYQYISPQGARELYFHFQFPRS